MSCKTTEYITRDQAISRIKEVRNFLRLRDYRNLEKISGESEGLQNIETFEDLRELNFPKFSESSDDPKDFEDSGRLEDAQGYIAIETDTDFIMLRDYRNLKKGLRYSKFEIMNDLRRDNYYGSRYSFGVADSLRNLKDNIENLKTIKVSELSEILEEFETLKKTTEKKNLEILILQNSINVLRNM